MACPSHPPHVSPVEDKTERPPFDTTDAIKVESQAVLYTLTEHNFLDAFTKMAKELGTLHTRRRGLL
jgi:hypothetical protein